MIKITKGVYGHQVGKSIQAKNADSEPFELTPEQEERLVKRGVAEYVIDLSEPEQLPEEDGGDGLGDGDLPEYDKSMKTDQLKEIALVYGVPAEILATAKNKDEIIALIAKADAGNDESDSMDDDSDSAPALNISAADPVQ